MAQENQSFADFIKDSREKKKKDQLASELLGKGSKKSGAGSINNTRNKNSDVPSLASRIGVSKQRSTTPKGNINGRWEHDKHPYSNRKGARNNVLQRTVSTPQLQRRNNRMFEELRSNEAARASNGNDNTGFSIRGMGSFTVIASNFAYGTTANDVKAVMEPVGGEIISCRVLISSPTVVMEVVFADKRGAEEVVTTFNNEKADGRVLHVYMKDTPANSFARPNNRSAPKVSKDDIDIKEPRGILGEGRLAAPSFQDGSYGFWSNGIPKGPCDPGNSSSQSKLNARRRL